MSSIIGSDPILLGELSRLTEDENTRLHKKLVFKKKKVAELEAQLDVKKEELAQVRTELDHILAALPSSDARPTVKNPRTRSKAPVAKEVSSNNIGFREDIAGVGAVHNAPSYAGEEYRHLNLDKFVFAGSPESMTVFNSWRSWQLENLHTSDGGSRPLSATPVWHGDQSGLFELIESVRAKEEKGWPPTSSMIYLSPEDLDGASKVADTFSILTTNLMVAPHSYAKTSGDRVRRLFGKPIPAFMRRDHSAWSYEGTFISKRLFVLGDVLWPSPAFKSSKVAITERFSHCVHPDPATSEGQIAIKAAVRRYAPGNQIVCVTFKRVGWDFQLHTSLQEAGSAVDGKSREQKHAKVSRGVKRQASTPDEKLAVSLAVDPPLLSGVPKSVEEFRLMRSAGLKRMGSYLLSAKLNTGSSVWHGDQPDLCKAIYRIQRESKVQISTKWTLYLSEQDFGRFKNHAKEFAIIQSRWVLGSHPDKQHLREYGKPIPVLLDRGSAGWSYEGNYVPKVLFSIGEDLWEDHHMDSAKRGMIDRLAHYLHPDLSTEAGRLAALKVKEHLASAQGIVCVGFKCVSWDATLYNLLQSALGSRNAKSN